MTTYHQQLISLITQDMHRVAALDAVARLDLPQCYIAAGFVRNLVWDYLHNNVLPTPLSDVDVIYFDRSEDDAMQQSHYEKRLSAVMPELNWQVRNQAIMHVRNGDPVYESTLDAMRYWPEQETAVAVRKVDDNTYQVISAFGLASLFAGMITPNPRRCLETFNDRLVSKGWLEQWPKLHVARA
ncbi:nucleotidyltransferase family protein [Vibrio sp. JPW-9-11-11]|uniref:nucleotidyltransferase family protein n=1 Tax=Vibrio sp. JPW-9-11-11 TaxID=1416532 RepID=UPI0015933151|nr:nucleotidyltransferase family protein [Vibrio sp. JPW-9-11-11]NVD07699.1 nucleotidyltransferase family protein [Vibrio sp. JPW-9-11-11]